MEELFNALAARLLNELKADEQLTLNLAAEHSHFTRINGAKLRQTGHVDDYRLSMSLIHNQRRTSASSTLTADLENDFSAWLNLLNELRSEIKEIPEDPYIVLPVAGQKSHYSQSDGELSKLLIADTLLPPLQGADITGIYAGGTLMRGHANSAGSQHWFETENFSFDYSLLDSAEHMVKGVYAGSNWNQDDFLHNLSSAQAQLEMLNRPTKRLAPGQYRTYIASAGVSDLLDMFSWHGVSEHAMQTGESALLKIRTENHPLSPHFSLREDFQSGLAPRFNDIGETAPEQLVIFNQGKLENTLVSSRTAKEFDLKTNYAAAGEYLRAPVMQCGNLAEADILTELDTGVYLSNLHYLNWSDVPGGRVTGMTRYACFWVENGEIQGPIENLRFDESLYHFFGDRLEAVTALSIINPEISTYGMRSLGGTICPGILLGGFTFTL
ncbi:MAG: TldD/PmbA family protein [Thiotrichales bacterium]